MGDTKGNFEIEGKLIATKRAQVRHSALEAARVATNRVLMDKLVNDYLMLVHPYPHIILRENKMIFGAHADRLQQGMRRSFGTAIGTAARIAAHRRAAGISRLSPSGLRETSEGATA